MDKTNKKGKKMQLERGSGILLHITSLPGSYGIGDLGSGGRKFINFLNHSGQKYWQFLPVNPTSSSLDNSPYMSFSAFAGNPMLIDPEQLVNDGLLAGKTLAETPSFSKYYVEFEKVIPYKEQLLQQAFNAFTANPASKKFKLFCQQETWLDDYALFMSLRAEHNFAPWHKWPRDLAMRQPKAIDAAHRRLTKQINYHKFLQFCFSIQWQKMRQFAAQQNITLIGDIPIYVAHDSADVWTLPDCFKLNKKTLEPTHVAGVPPDYFSNTGQRWGNPVFRWSSNEIMIKNKLYTWWRQRFKRTFSLLDIARVDHFRGFESYWEIAAHEKTAINGKWVTGPGQSFFNKMCTTLEQLPIIAEDLGIITPKVEQLRDTLGFPGMKVLQFAFDSDATNSYLPHNYLTTNCVVYTGTHDNDTTLGWYMDNKTPAHSKEHAMRYANSKDGSPVHWNFIRMAFASTAALAIIPLQDILGFGSDCRMNRPSTTEGNWRWRCADRFLNNETAIKLKHETIFYNRI